MLRSSLAAISAAAIVIATLGAGSTAHQPKDATLHQDATVHQDTVHQDTADPTMVVSLSLNRSAEPDTGPPVVATVNLAGASDRQVPVELIWPAFLGSPKAVNGCQWHLLGSNSGYCILSDGGSPTAPATFTATFAMPKVGIGNEEFEASIDTDEGEVDPALILTGQAEAAFELLFTLYVRRPVVRLGDAVQITEQGLAEGAAVRLFWSRGQSPAGAYRVLTSSGATTWSVVIPPRDETGWRSLRLILVVNFTSDVTEFDRGPFTYTLQNAVLVVNRQPQPSSLAGR